MNNEIILHNKSLKPKLTYIYGGEDRKHHHDESLTDYYNLFTIF